MIDRKFIGLSTEPHVVPVEEGQLKFFAKVTGQTDPIYSDLAAAKAAGYPAIPAPPTFFYSLNLARPDPYFLMQMINVDLNRVLHAEQSFTYGAPILAGDVITMVSRVTNIYDKKGGTLEFIALETLGTNQRSESVGSMVSVCVVRG